MKSPSIFMLLICLLQLSSCSQDRKTNQKNPDNKKNSPAWELAASFYEKEPDSAFFYFSKLVETSKDSVEIARAYTCIGILQNNKGFYYDSQENFIKSLKLLNDSDSSNYRFISNNYNELGLTEVNLKKFDDALSNFDRALLFSKDSSEILTILNNKAITLVETQKYNDAIKLYDSILLKSKNESQNYAMILANLARTKWLKDPSYNAVPEMHRALQIRLKGNNKWGLNAGYGRLSEYYFNSSPDSALIYARKMYEVARELDSPDDIVFALQKMIQLGSVDSIKTYFTYYQHLNDSIQNAQKRATNRFAVILYETEKQKADNLILQKENAETKLRVIWLQVISLIIGTGAITGFIFYRKRKLQAMRKQELRTSQKVHDVVANGLYTIINKIEHEEKLEKDQLLDEMEVLYEQSRNISYDRSETRQHHSEELIPGLLKSFSTQETRVSIVGYSPALWSCLSTKAQSEIRYALQNLMINMKKHSRAKNVVVRFEQTDHHLKIHYTDDGIGVPANFRYGNGLTGTETRIKHIGGQLIFDASTPRGVKCQILIPIEQAQ